MEIPSAFQGKRVVVLGLARQGLALARIFAAAGAQVTVRDSAPAEKLAREVEALAGLPVALALGGHPESLLDGCNLLCLSGGVPPQLPFVQQAVAQGVPLSNDSLLTFQWARQRGLGPLVAITGSSGKTTTTTLVGRMLAASGQKVHVGGNIGAPLLDRLETVQPGEPIVLELSSFQLELFDPALAWGPLEGAGPDVAAILNITPNHLDRHPSMAAYAAAKFNLPATQPSGSSIVLNADDPVTGRLVRPMKRNGLPAGWQLDAPLAAAQSLLEQLGSTVIPFSRAEQLGRGAWLEGEMLVLDGEPICRRSELLLRGEHNISNVLAAAAISAAAGADVSAMGEAARSFAGVPHRLEVVAEQTGVTWINDSIATSPERAVAAMRSFEPGRQTLILLAGGKDKNLPWDQFADEALQRVSMLIGFGAAGPMIVRTVQERAQLGKRPAPSCAVVQRLDEAVDLAARAAGPNTVVLLAPGGTSYDAYRDFEERGAHFGALVARCLTPDEEGSDHPASLSHRSG